MQTAVVIENDAVDAIPCWEIVRPELQLNANEQVVHLDNMANIFNVCKQVQQSIMHWIEASVETFMGEWLVSKVKVEGAPVICNTITFKSVPEPLKLPTASLVLDLSLYLEHLLIEQAILS